MSRKGGPSPLKGRPAITRRPLTKARREAFLSELRKHGVFAAAAKAASPHAPTDGVVTSFRDLVARDPAFAAEVGAAIEQANAAVEHEIWRRSQEGWKEPVFYMGEVVGEITKFSDRLLELRAKAAMPERYAPERNLNVRGELTAAAIPAGALVLTVDDLSLLSDTEARQLTDLLKLIETRRDAPAIDAANDEHQRLPLPR